MHYIVVRDGQIRNLAFGGGYGYGLDYHVAVGPDLVLAWLDERARHLDPDPYREWLGDVLCEGGVLLDVDEKVMLVFSELPWLHSIADAYPCRLAMLDGWSRTWPGWRIEWAYDGLADLARYVGADPELLHDLGPPGDLRFEPGNECYLVTAGGTSWALPGSGHGPWEYGPRLLDLLAEREPITALDHVPHAGLHLDRERRHARLWTIRPLCGARERWPRLWPGWQLTFDEDRHHTGLPSPDPAPALAGLAERIRTYWVIGRGDEIEHQSLFPPGDLPRRAANQDEEAARLDFEARYRAAKRVREAALPALQRLADAQADLLLGTTPVRPGEGRSR